MASVILITGTPGSGKSSVSSELAKLFKKSAVIEVDQLRRFVKSGFVNPAKENDASKSQLILGLKNTAPIIRNFLKESYIVIIDDVVTAWTFTNLSQLLPDLTFRKFLLRPSLEEAKKRNTARADYALSEDRVGHLYDQLKQENTEQEGWVIINSTNQTPLETAQEILKRVQEDENHV